MRKIKIAIAVTFMAIIVATLATQALGYPPFMAKAKKYGAKDCTFCHVDPAGGTPWNERGDWLMKEKEKRNADAIDVDWLAQYKPAKKGKKKSAEPQAVAQGAKQEKKTNAAASPASVEQELIKVEREWLDAYTSRDVAAMQRIEADDFTITYPNGKVSTKADEIAGLKGPAPDGPRPALSTEETKVRLYGDVAVLTGVFVQTGTHAEGGMKGQQYKIKERYTDVWVKSKGQWQVVASHLTHIGPPPAMPQMPAAPSQPSQPPQPVQPTQPATPAANVDPKVFDAYVGQYETPFGPLNITKEGDKLFGQPEGDTKEELIPESETVFNVLRVGAKVTFVKGADGKVTHMVLNLHGQEMQSKKIK